MSERFYPAAPGAGWFSVDELSMSGKLGGAIALSGGYAHDPLRLSDGGKQFDLVSHQAFADVAIAVTFDRFRAYIGLSSPLVVKGEDGSVGTYSYTSPTVDPGQNPDTISDVRLGFDTRLYGGPKSAFRLGIGWQLFISSGQTADYVTDGTARGMGRLMFAGDIGSFTYAGHIGVHFRPLDDARTPASPRGSELLYALALGPRFLLGEQKRMALVIGPEIFGQSALRALFAHDTTGVEALLSGRLEGTGAEGPQLRVKLAAGWGIANNFGTPEWRFLVGVEVFARSVRSSAKK